MCGCFGCLRSVVFSEDDYESIASLIAIKRDARCERRPPLSPPLPPPPPPPEEEEVSARASRVPESAGAESQSLLGNKDEDEEEVAVVAKRVKNRI